jgi:signal peptidase I
MMPTFNDGDKLIVSNLFYEPQRGDVVVFNDKTNSGYDGTPIIKRIIALEGDIVKIEGGIIYVKESGKDNFSIVNYVEDMDIPHRDMEEVTVPQGEMFVMGDNVNLSKDSRDPMVGTIKVKSIIGKVILRFYAENLVYSEAEQKFKKNGRIVFDTDFITAK